MVIDAFQSQKFGVKWHYASLKGQKWAKIAVKLKKWQFSSTHELRNANLLLKFKSL